MSLNLLRTVEDIVAGNVLFWAVRRFPSFRELVQKIFIENGYASDLSPNGFFVRIVEGPLFRDYRQRLMIKAMLAIRGERF